MLVEISRTVRRTIGVNIDEETAEAAEDTAIVAAFDGEFNELFDAEEDFFIDYDAECFEEDDA